MRKLSQLALEENSSSLIWGAPFYFKVVNFLAISIMTDKKEILAKNINERCLLMACSEADAVCECPQLGEEIYKNWIENMDASNPDDFDLSELVRPLSNQYQVAEAVVSSLFETIRQLVLRYDDLIDRISVEIN